MNIGLEHIKITSVCWLLNSEVNSRPCEKLQTNYLKISNFGDVTPSNVLEIYQRFGKNRTAYIFGV